MRSKTWMLAMAGIAFSSFARAEDVDPFALSPEQLFNATVSSVSRTAEKLWDAPAAVYVLSSEDIRRLGATSIPETLRAVPGVQVARVNANSWAISVRGFNTGLANKLLVLIDGREVYDPLYSGVYWDVQDTMLEDVERIEVIRGPGASLWGANAVNGVINIITKSASDTQGGLVSALAGNKETGTVGVRQGGAFGADGHYRVYGKYLSRDNEKWPNGINGEDEWDAYRTGFRADWAKVESSQFTVQGDAYRSHTGQIRMVPTLTFPYSVPTEENIHAEGINLLGRWTRDYDDGAQLIVQGYVDYNFRNQYTLKTGRTTLDLDTQYELPYMERNQIILGGKYRLSGDDLSQNNTGIITFDEANRLDQTLSAFIQDKITLEPEKWYLTLGSKFEVNDYSEFEVQPNARLQWHPDENQMVWGAVSRAVRVPSRLEYDLISVTGVIPPFPPFLPNPISVDLYPSPGFDSEELIAYEIGYRRKITPEAMLDTTAFYNVYDRLSTLRLGTASGPVGSPTHVILPIFITNDTTAEVYGGEAVLDWHVSSDLRLSAAYSYLNISMHGPPSNVAIDAEGDEDESPQHQFNVQMQWDVTPEVTVSPTFYHVSAAPGLGIDNYERLDVNLEWRVDENVSLSLVGQNLLRSDHREFGNEIGRSVYGQVLWRF